jgi:hypothetical protein
VPHAEEKKDQRSTITLQELEALIEKSREAAQGGENGEQASIKQDNS